MIKADILKKEDEKFELLKNLKRMKNVGYSDVEIAKMFGIKSKQVISSIRRKGLDYQISFKKARIYNNKIYSVIGKPSKN